MDEAQFDKLVERWDERDAWFKGLAQRWEERDRRWEERDRRWRDDDREHREFMREMWGRMERMDIRQQAAHEHVIGRLDALTKAVLRVVDRLDGEGGAAAAG